jgi:hypothetical protein
LITRRFTVGKKTNPVVGQETVDDKPAGPRKPDYILSAKDKITGSKHRVGAGWYNPSSDSISIRLDRFVVLHGGEQNMLLTLFTNRETEE